MKRLLLLLFVLATAALAQEPETLVYGAGLTPRGMIPLLDRNEWNEVSSAIYSRLFRPDHTGKIVGDLVESYIVSEDGRTYTLKLRRNVLWHDGKPLTSADVVFTWDVLFDPKTETSLDLNQPMLERWEARGPHEVAFYLKYADAGFLAPLTEVAVLPAHRLKGLDINDPARNRQPVGTGAYKLTVSGTSGYMLTRHDAYHFGPAKFAAIEMRIIPDDDERAKELADGSVHLTQVKPQHIAKLRSDPKLRVYRMATGAWRAMPLNLRRAAMKDVRVRRAIDLAIDREAIVKSSLAGVGQAAYSPIPPASWAFDPAMNTRRHDPKAAARLLDEAGWRTAKDGIRRKNGQPLTLKLIVWKEEIFRRTAAEAIRDQLRPLGFDVQLDYVDNTTYNRLAGSPGEDYDSFIGGWGGLLDPGDNLYKKFHSKGSQNYGAYANPEVDRRLEEVRALPPAERERAKKLYRELVELLIREAAWIPLVYPEYVVAADARVTGVGEFVCDSWYEFPKFAHEWGWK
jgi:peptide/nickel transport system substrate-binding protein